MTPPTWTAASPTSPRSSTPTGCSSRPRMSKDLQERGAHGARYLSLTPDTLGGVRIKGYASLEEAELVKTTLMTLAAPIVTEPGACGGDPTTLGQIRFDDHGRRVRHGCPDPTCAHDGRDTRDHGVRMWDALIEACQRLHDTDNLPHAHSTSARLTVTMSLEDLRDRLDAQGLLPSRGHPLRRRRPPTGLRHRNHPRGPRHPESGPRRRPHQPPGHHRHLDRTSPPRPPLRLPRLHPSPHRLRRPPHHPLGRRRSDIPGQSDPALQETPHARPPNPLASRDRPDHPPTRVDPTPTHRRPRPTHLHTSPTTTTTRRLRSAGLSSAPNLILSRRKFGPKLLLLPRTGLQPLDRVPLPLAGSAVQIWNSPSSGWHDFLVALISPRLLPSGRVLLDPVGRGGRPATVTRPRLTHSPSLGFPA